MRRQTFVEAMRLAPHAVAVVTTLNASVPTGITVTAWCSLSAEPPSLLVCINRGSPTASAIAASRLFCLNLLADDQSHLADLFAGRLDVSREQRFRAAPSGVIVSGAPALDGSLVAFDCVLSGHRSHGSHDVFFGNVTALKFGEGRPLVYCDRRYGHVVHHAESV